MGKYDKLKAQNQQITSDIKYEATHFQEISAEYNRVAEIYSAPSIILNDIDRQFSAATKLNGVDIAFLFFATALQCVRQYAFDSLHFKSKEERPSDKKAADNTWGHKKEHSDRSLFYYNPSLAEILSNPVPFDAQFGSSDFDLGLSGNLHRPKTLGHDPILGWIFGTANIATNTLTTWEWKSYHIKTGQTKNGNNRDKIIAPAKTLEIFEHVSNKLLGKEGRLDDSFSKEKLIHNPNSKFAGPAIIAASIGKEAIHLKSDVKSKNSLPLPIISTISPEFANTLAKYGLDMANVLTAGKQATYATLINFIIATIHRLLYDESRDGAQKLYEVRTRKILSYSNVIASASNVIFVALTAEATGGESLKKLDIGGLAVTLYRLIADAHFIKEVKIEFLEKQWYDDVVGEDYSFMEVK